MKKQLLKVRHFADQNRIKNEKSEVLNVKLLSAEKRVECLRTVCSNLSRRYSELIVTNTGEDKTRRLKKLPEHHLGLACKDSAYSLGIHTLLGYILHILADTESRLAMEKLDYESELNLSVLEKSALSQLIDNDIPNVAKLRKSLSKSIIDMDSAKSKYYNAQRHHFGSVSSIHCSAINLSDNYLFSNSSSSNQKFDTIRDDMDMCEMRVEQQKDNLAGDMFQLLSRESELAQLLLHSLKLKAEYHRNSSQIIDQVVSDLQLTINNSSFKPVYGFSLADHLRTTGREIALPIEMCVCRLIQLGVQEEGILRIAGSSSKVRKLKNCFDACLVDFEYMQEFHEVHVIADVLKSYLRDLPDPLMYSSFYGHWIEAIKPSSISERLNNISRILHQLPEENYNNLRYIVKFLTIIANEYQVNKMNSQNIAIVMAPTLLFVSLKSQSMEMSLTAPVSVILDLLITNCDWLFACDDFTFFVTASASYFPHSEQSHTGPALTPVSVCNESSLAQSPVHPPTNVLPPTPSPTSPVQRKPTVCKSPLERAQSSVVAAAISDDFNSLTSSILSHNFRPIAAASSFGVEATHPRPYMRRRKPLAPAPPHTKLTSCDSFSGSECSNSEFTYTIMGRNSNDNETCIVHSSNMPNINATESTKNFSYDSTSPIPKSSNHQSDCEPQIFIRNNQFVPSQTLSTQDSLCDSIPLKSPQHNSDFSMPSFQNSTFYTNSSDFECSTPSPVISQVSSFFNNSRSRDHRIPTQTTAFYVSPTPLSGVTSPAMSNQDPHMLSSSSIKQNVLSDQHTVDKNVPFFQTLEESQRQFPLSSESQLKKSFEKKIPPKRPDNLPLINKPSKESSSVSENEQSVRKLLSRQCSIRKSALCQKIE